MLIYKYVYSRPAYLCTDDPDAQQRLAQVAQDDRPSDQQRENIQLREFKTATAGTDTVNSFCEFYMVAELCLTRGIPKQQQWTTGRGLDPRALGDFQQNTPSTYTQQWRQQQTMK